MCRQVVYETTFMIKLTLRWAPVGWVYFSRDPQRCGVGEGIFRRQQTVLFSAGVAVRRHSTLGRAGFGRGRKITLDHASWHASSVWSGIGGWAAHWGDTFGWTLRERAQNAKIQIADFLNENREMRDSLTEKSNCDLEGLSSGGPG